MKITRIQPKWLVTNLLALVVLMAIVFTFKDELGWLVFRPTPSAVEQARVQREPEVVAQNLSIPWEVAFLPGSDLMVTERPGSLKRIGANQQTYPIEGVQHEGEGGLLGLALHPNFEDNQWLYLYLTSQSGEGLVNRVERYRLEGNRLVEKQVIIANIPGAAIHDGGRLAFGPDGLLYITTGDAGQGQLAQDINSLAGKILRLTDEGQFPHDNPFGNAVYSYGHRNPQGIAWDSKNQLWATEHGQSHFDELNLIKPGANYGWPLIVGDGARTGMENPVIHSGPDETWAPTGLASTGRWLFFGGLRGESLYQVKLDAENRVTMQSHYAGQYGRLRAVAIGPDGWLYFTTSNTDDRGQARDGDDKIIKINLQALTY